MNEVVIEASALIAYIEHEPATKNLIDLLPYLIISAEVATILSNLRITAAVIVTTLML